MIGRTRDTRGRAAGLAAADGGPGRGEPGPSGGRRTERSDRGARTAVLTCSSTKWLQLNCCDSVVLVLDGRRPQSGARGRSRRSRRRPAVNRRSALPHGSPRWPAGLSRPSLPGRRPPSPPACWPASTRTGPASPGIGTAPPRPVPDRATTAAPTDRPPHHPAVGPRPTRSRPGASRTPSSGNVDPPPPARGIDRDPLHEPSSAR